VSEDWKIQLSVKNKQGDMVNVRANTAAEVDAIVAEAIGKNAFDSFFVRAEPGPYPVEVPKAPAVTVQDVTEEAKPPSDIEALENLAKFGATPADDRAAKIRALLDAKKGK
jgi:hypothetical protein